jgi:hypothetical protein
VDGDEKIHKTIILMFATGKRERKRTKDIKGEKTSE